MPLSIDSSSYKAIEAACKHCAGKPLINSVNGEEEKLNLILPIVKRYGASVIALTVDEKGIPKTAQERLRIAEKILKFAEKYNINKNEIIFDYLTLSASSSPEQAQETLKAVKKSKQIYPENKILLGVSNISFGLPARQVLNSTFFKMAAECGLDVAICNPSVDWTIDDENARNLLNNKDANAKEYVKKYSSFQKQQVENINELSAEDKLFNAILNGDKDYIVDLIDWLLKQKISPLTISNNLILKALNSFNVSSL